MSEIENSLQKLIILLDAGPLSLITNPKANQESRSCQQWVQSLLKKGIAVTSTEMPFYEVRRELIRSQKNKGVERLDNLRESMEFLPITIDHLIKASELWAWARNTGQQTAHDIALDADVILAAQAICLAHSGFSVIIATTNPKDLARYTPTLHWKQATLTALLKLNNE